MRRKLIGLLSTMAIAGCTTSPVANETTTSTISKPSTSTSVSSYAAGGFEVQSLGLTFALATTFQSVQDPTYAFLARSNNPPAVFSIDSGTPDDATAYTARSGESLSSVSLGGLKNVVVTNASISGLPPGVEANELLVANATRSFSVIMSAVAADLPAMWQAFITSVQVAPV